jgi:threonyl-tRNA synthetase
MVTITFPDGNKREYDAGITGEEIAVSISKGLAKEALAITLNGEEFDLYREIESDSDLTIIKPDSDAGLEIIRHDAAHLMAQAVKELYPETQVTIGPAIENGFYYDFAREKPFSTADLEVIEKKMRELSNANIPVRRELWKRDEAVKFFKDMGEEYKAEIIASIPSEEDITLYRQGDFIDLCRGPHAPSTGKIKHFKLMKVAGAYWRGDSNNEMLQRIYGTAWATEKQLKQHLLMLEEAEKRDHRRLGAELDLFHFEESAPGQPFWHDKGWTVYNLLIEYMRSKLKKYNYTEVNTPQMLDINFWKYSGHWYKYRENMFVVDEQAEMPFALKPMSCPGNVQIFKQGMKSYRDLPTRMAEFGKVFRHEAHGARHGLLRVQGFTQDDAHIFCTPEQLEDEVILMCQLINEVYTELGLTDFVVKLSTRPEVRIGREEDWDAAEKALQNVCERINLNWELNPGDGAFYAPKLDFKVRDAIGREWQLGTIQVDLNLPERLDISYIGEDGEKHRPFMIHRAIMGAIERFMGILIEHYAGKFPLWLTPVQVAVCTITNDIDGYGEEVKAVLDEANIRSVLDISSNKIGFKIREHSNQKVPIILSLGAREMENKSVSIRRLGSKDQETLALADAIAIIIEQSRLPES